MSPSSASVIICDRGVLDIKGFSMSYAYKLIYISNILFNKGYMPESLWQKLLKRMNLNENDLLNRYDVVCHLVTAGTFLTN